MPIKIAVINGPNLNMLGKREAEHYGKTTLTEINKTLEEENPEALLHFFQSNHEGALIDHIHSLSAGDTWGIVINAGAFTHTSIALRDALLAADLPYIEVHLSNVHSRENFRHLSYLADKAVGVISGLGYQSYDLAIKYFINKHV